MAKEVEPLDEVSRLLATLIRLQVGTQADAIRELSKLDLGPKRIAELLGTTPNTVTVTMAKTRKSRGGTSDR